MRTPARLGSLAAAISIAAAAVPASVAADPSSCQPGAAPVGGDPSVAGGVDIHVTASNSVIWCSPAVIATGGINGNYPLRATSQSPNDNPVSNAMSVNQLLTLARVNPQTVSFTYAIRPSGTWATLSTADLSDHPPFMNGLMPIVWTNGGETDYMRPLRSPTDTNADDFITAQNGAVLDLYVSSGPLLAVTANATPTKVSTKRPVTFTASVSNQTATDGTLTYKWSFQDGSTATGAGATHSFTAVGTYYPVVTVYGAGNDSGGVSQPIPVTVGSPPKGDTSGTPGGGNRNKHVSPNGPASSRGKTPASVPSHKPSGSSGATNTSGNHQTSTPSVQSTPQSTMSSQATTAQTTATTSTTTAVRAPKPAAHPPSRNQTPPQTNPGTTVVAGRLISDVIPVSAAQLAQQNRTSGKPAAPAARLGGGSLTPVAGIAGGCAIILLLGSGAGLELRSQRRPVAPGRPG